MNKIPPHIVNFIEKNHVVSLACFAQETIWAASCFYVFDPENTRLIILTKITTTHGKMMLANPRIAGTIASQPKSISQIEGIQFSATARCLTDKTEKLLAQSHYFSRHPLAKLISSDVWELRLDNIKHTENRTAFAQKTVWKR